MVAATVDLIGSFNRVGARRPSPNAKIVRSLRQTCGGIAALESWILVALVRDFEGGLDKTFS